MESAMWRAIIMFFVGSVYLYFDSINQVNTHRTTRDPNHRFSSDSLFSFVPHKHDKQTKSKHFEIATLTDVKKDSINLSWRDRTKWESKLDKHEYPYLVNPKRKCKDTGQGFETPRNITLLILVKSAPGNSKLRDAIRKTYMHRIEERRLSCKVLFLLGVSRDGDDARVQEIADEALTYGDILQEDFTDSYFNLTIKLVMGLKWASTFCPNSNFIMSTDDDVMIDIDFLLEDLQNVPPADRSNFVLGKRLLDGKPLRIKENKWYIPHEVYPGEQYPPFALGHGYVMSQSISKRAYHMSLEFAPPVPWDDVYFGMLLEKLGGITILNRNTWYMQKRTSHRKEEMAPQFDYLKIELSIEGMYKAWQAIESEDK